MKHIVIFGPTAIGKTSLSIKLARHLDTEIISADSAQVYKKLNIGTAKISKEEMKGIKHHLIDVVEPCTKFDVAKFVNFGSVILENLENKNRQAIIVGGTGLYIKALSDGLVDLPADSNLRSQLESQDAQYLHDRLQEVDSNYAERVPPNNKRRVVRALEVFELTGKPFSYLHSFSKSKFSFHKFALTRDREEIYKNINKRTDIMMKKGLLEEAKKIYEEYKHCLDEINIIGYKELFSYLKGELTLQEAIDLIKKNSRNYAKRQITWMKANNFDVIDVDKIDPLKYILNKVDRS
ncbi:MAG TPA: tRNA (adenosine(37)-N6)-dimethylallyltransferase MiaA [Fusobacteria bacterium]|nr:tRNA (adenosine(37)-N6)-dimethylallyltransferase MiaA [Fusobacteriota bacterium]